MKPSPKIQYRNLAILLEYDRQIRKYDKGKVRYKKQILYEVAKKFHVNQSVIKNVLHDRRWMMYPIFWFILGFIIGVGVGLVIWRYNIKRIIREIQEIERGKEWEYLRKQWKKKVESNEKNKFRRWFHIFNGVFNCGYHNGRIGLGCFDVNHIFNS